MPDDPALQLVKALEDGTLTAGRSRHRLKLWIALRDGDKATLRAEVQWARDRTYRVDPLPSRISGAYADLLYGEPPAFTPANDRDEELLADLVGPGATSLADSLRTAVADLSSPEGEVWWRVYTDRNESDHPVLDWHSRMETVPLWHGKKLAAVAFISEHEGADKTTWRYVQVHSPGRADNLLFQAAQGVTGVGTRKALSAHPHTASLDEEWRHGLDLLAGRVPNRLGRDHSDGIGDYDQVEDLLLDLNEAHSVDAENYRLAGKKRAVLPARYADHKGEFDASEDVFWTSEQAVDSEMPEGRLPDVFKLLSYDYDADGAQGRKEDLTVTILTRVGLARQMVDANRGEGFAQSGTALRTRLIPTTLAAQGKGRVWDRESRRLLTALQRVDALEEARGGFNRPWTAAAEAPTVQRSSVLPEDPAEEVNRHTQLVGAELESTETALQEMHPQWTKERVREELQRIRADYPTVEE